LASSSGALSAALEEELASISAVASSALVVDSLELRFGEVSRNSSILETNRFSLWPTGGQGAPPENEETGSTVKDTPRLRRARSAATPSREASHTASPPATPRTPRTRPQGDAALSRFRSELLRREGTYAAAWRRLLDCAGHGSVSFADFCDACRRMNYTGNIKDAWHALDADGSGKVTLCEFHWGTAEALSRFVASLQSSFGSLESAAKQLSGGGRRIRKEEFRSLMEEYQILSASEADNIFRMICCNSTMARPSVRAQEFEWLQQLSQHLPHPKGRVAPGAVTDVAELELPNVPPDLEMLLGGPLEDTRTTRSASQPAPRRRQALQDGEDLYERLHREAKVYHARKKEKHENEGLFRQPGTPHYDKPCGNTAHLEKLYKQGQIQKRKQEKMADEYYEQLRGHRHKRKIRDEEVWARLQAKREIKEIKSEAEEEKPKDNPKLKYKGPPRRPPPSGSVKEASERLYAAARKIESKKKELADKADQENRKKEEELKKKVGPITKAREVEIVQRLHREDQQKREEETLKRKQEKEAAEEEIRRLAVRKKGKARPETFFRLHLEQLQREETLAEKRRAKKEEEENRLKAESIHNRSTRNPRVFHRLYHSKRQVPADAEEEDAAYSGSETFETTSSPPETRRAGREVTEVTEVVPAVPAAKAVARTPQKQPERRAEDEFREARLRPRPDPRAALQSLAVPQADPPQEDPTQSSRVAPGERTEWTERHRDPQSDEFDRLDIISRRPLGSFRRAAPGGSSRRSVTGAELSRELFGDNDTTDEEPLPSHSSYPGQHGDPWLAMAELVSWDEKEP